jgi:septum formation protein
MEEAGFWFEAVSFPFDETYPEDMPTYHVAEFLAEEKSKHAIHSIKDDEILLTADSIVVLGNTVFGKPRDFEDAYRILATLSGKKHLVYTGICLADLKTSISFTGKSEVYFREMNHDEITWYINEYKPYDKAGAYAVQEWIGLCKISSIHGTYANIMGLPTDLVYEGLKHFENTIAFQQ